MPQLSAFLITKNEARDITRCLESLRGVADEVVVVDDFSVDGTPDMCRKLGARVLQRTFDGFAAQKQYALEQTTGTWALSIDADEHLTSALADEIRTRVRSNPPQDGFEVRRNFYFLGKRLRFGGLGADWVLRLFRREKGRFPIVKVHEHIEVAGPIGRLINPMEHDSYPTLEEYLQKRDHYTTLAAQELWARGRRPRWIDTLRPSWELFARVVLKGAWLDGPAGLTYAALSAGTAGLRDRKLHLLTMAPPAPRRFLIVRTDRLGDVMLTTPVSRRLKEHVPGATIAWLVQPYTAPLLEHNPDIDQVIVDRGGSVDRLARTLREGQFDAAIVAYPRWRAAWAVWKAGIPLRIGPASKWYSALFNRRIWQHRSEGKKHEADYNLELLGALDVPFQRTETRFVLTAEERAWAKGYLEGMRIGFHKPVVCIHPGSGGSSERWPLRQFMELGDRLQEAGCDVVVTGGPGEGYQTIMIDQMRRIPVFVAAGSVSVRQLASILSWCNLVVSNSTGPLHIAVALGIPTISVYSPIPTCHPTRWGPYPAYAQGLSQHTVFMPAHSEQSISAMSTVSVETVLAECQKKLGFLQKVPVA